MAKQDPPSPAARGRVTIKDVAREAGVSTTAVSFVLNGRGQISNEVAARIHAAILAVGYRPNTQARAIRTGRTRTIGLVVPDLRNPFFPELADAVGNAIFKAGYAMLFGYGHDVERERESLLRFAAEGVDGICWCPVSDRDTPREIGLTQPVVVIDRPIDHYDSVLSNYRMGGALLAEEILRRGACSIGLINGPADLSFSLARRGALLDALNGACELVWDINNPFSIRLEEETRQCILSHPVDAIICANDTIAIGALRLLRQAGVAVPQQTIVTGFDDIPFAELTEPSLTTIRQPLQEIGDRAIDLLLARIAQPDRPVSRLEVDVALIPRETT